MNNQCFRKEELRKGIANFTYKSILASIFKNRRLRVEREDNAHRLSGGEQKHHRKDLSQEFIHFLLASVPLILV